MPKILFVLFISLASFGLLQGQSKETAIEPALGDSVVPSPKKDSIQQKDLVDIIAKMININANLEKRDNRNVRFSLFPTQSNANTNKALVTTINISFLLGNEATTNISTVYFIPYISFSNQYGFQLQPNIWLENNRWNFTGEYFILNFPQSTWGLGGNSGEESETLVESKHLRIYQNALVRLFPRLAVGVGYALDRHFAIYVTEQDKLNIKDYQANTVSSGFTFPAIVDTRRNSINPERGMMSAITYSLYLPALGSDDKWQSFFWDVRKYLPFSTQKPSILAFRSFYWTVISGKAPYFDLPSVRWEPALGSASRGIQKGRYRSNAMLYAESEYRFGISANGLWGGVVFANVTAPSEYGTQNFKYWHPAAGAGVRLKFNKYSRTNVTFDFGMSKEYFSVYLNIGEAF